MIPITDISNGKITGCKNSKEYYHEEAHINFNKSNLGMNIQYIGEQSIFWTIIFLVLTNFINFFKWFSLIGIFIMLFCFIFEEIWCNYTAREKINNLKKR